MRRGSHFDAVASAAYEDSIPRHVMQHLTRRRVALVQAASRAGRVLDVGCGTGTLLNGLPGQEYQRFGIDLSIGMLRQARAKDGKLRLSLASATALPFDDETFDVVVCAAVLHHIAEPAAVGQVISEMIRVTTYGGTAVIWDHNPTNPYWPILMRRVPQDIGEERLIPREELLSALRVLQERYALTVCLRQMTFVPDFTPVWALKGLAVVERALERTPFLRHLSAHNVALVTKLAKGGGNGHVGR